MNIQITKISDLVLYALKKKEGIAQPNVLLKLDFLTDNLVKRIINEIDIDLSFYRFALTSSSINHSLKNHSNSKIEAKRNPPQRAVQNTDFEILPLVFYEPDKVVKAEKVGDTQRVKFVRNIDDNGYVAVAEIRTGKKSICLVTLYIVNNKTPTD